MKQTKKVMRNKKRVLTKRLREKRRKRHTKKKGDVKRGGGNFLLPFWQGMLLEINDMYGLNQDMTDTIRHNLKVLPPEKEDPWAGGGGKVRGRKKKRNRKK
tara:strand:- start:303 stop:605 length:303 start_codon:yes stop_codon:yes gene_type:complete